MNPTDAFHPEKTKIPHHVGIIPDGGRRWAQANGCSLVDAYNKTKLLIREMTIFLIDSGVFEVSIYLSSIQNFRRASHEIEAFNDVSAFAFKNDIVDLARLKGLKINVAGNRNVISPGYLNAIELAEAETYNFENGVINICVAYNPIDEILDALSKATEPSGFLNHLWVTTPLDLIIRSGGANLLSNFLPLQSGFARLIFFDQLFNDLTLDDLRQIYMDFYCLERKFGD